MSKKKSYIYIKKFYIVVLLTLLFCGVFFYFYNNKAFSAVTIGGDVYSGRDVGNIIVKEKSVISANQSVNFDELGTAYPIGDYSLTTLQDLVSPRRVTNIIEKLEKIDHEAINSTGFNSLDAANFNKKNFPEGTIWIRNGDLAISSEITFNGKGTIVVKNGNLIIDRNIKYANDNTVVGFIVSSGNIIIHNTNIHTSSQYPLRGIYFTTREIIIGD